MDFDYQLSSCRGVDFIFCLKCPTFLKSPWKKVQTFFAQTPLTFQIKLLKIKNFQKYFTTYQEMPKFFIGLCKPLPLRYWLDLGTDWKRTSCWTINLRNLKLQFHQFIIFFLSWFYLYMSFFPSFFKKKIKNNENISKNCKIEIYNTWK